DETLVENIIPIQNLFREMYFQFSDQLGAENQDSFFTALRLHAGELWGTMFDRPVTPEQQMLDCFEKSVLASNSHSSQQARELAEQMFHRFTALSTSNVRFNAGATETLAALKDAGFTTGIITNGIEQLQLGKIHTLGLDQQVDHVIVSAQARAHKPHLKVFNLALDQAGVEAEQAWQVGDNAINDVAGAIRAGMGGVFYDPTKEQLHKAFSDLRETPTHVIHDLPEVVELALAG
ncbi:MAG: HAD family hydrolase, partial [Gammaproteobacteria bacterium]|nr:HAD family hydrolase [Gammaproteobacteria bacterium]